MEPFNVVICHADGLAKEPHPLGAMPVKPFSGDFKDAAKLKLAMDIFTTTLRMWNDVDEKLQVYSVKSMVCDSKIVVSNDVLHWHVGNKYKAVLLDGWNIQII